MEQYFYLKEHFVMDYMVHHPKLQWPVAAYSYFFRHCYIRDGADYILIHAIMVYILNR